MKKVLIVVFALILQLSSISMAAAAVNGLGNGWIQTTSQTYALVDFGVFTVCVSVPAETMINDNRLIELAANREYYDVPVTANYTYSVYSNGGLETFVAKTVDQIGAEQARLMAEKARNAQAAYNFGWKIGDAIARNNGWGRYDRDHHRPHGPRRR